MAIVSSDPLSLGQTLGTLLTAVIDAQAQAARATVEFIEEVGIVDDNSEAGSSRDLRHVEFKYKKLDENFESNEFVLELPLLSMVDIPLLAVKTATFKFNYQITKTTKPSDSDSTPKASSSNTLAAKPTSRLTLYKARPALLEGAIRKKSFATETEEKGGLDITVEVEKAALPVGLDRILEILELAATETKASDEA